VATTVDRSNIHKIQCNNSSNIFQILAASAVGSCEEYEQRLIAMSTDMEYLRSAALQNEYVCRECQNEESSLHSKESLLRLTEASARLSEIEKRHLEQIEELTEQAVSN
jgi:hypothetical protein